MLVRFVDWIVLAIGLIGLAVTTSWAIYAAPNSAENLQAKLQYETEALLFDAGYNWAEVIVEGQSAIVSGRAPTPDIARAALDVLSHSTLMGPLTAIRTEIVSVPPVTPYEWMAVRGADGQLSLTGYVPNEAIRSTILEAAENIWRDRVTSTLQLGSGEPSGDWQAAALTGLAQLALLDEGEARLVDADLFISGTTNADGAADSILTALSLLKSPFTGTAFINGVDETNAQSEELTSEARGGGGTSLERNGSQIEEEANRSGRYYPHLVSFQDLERR